jgi:hypothetical protein
LDDNLLGLIGQGYGASGGYGNGAIINVLASQAWTNTAHGACIQFLTTTNGSVALAEAMRIDHNGNVGIGTTAPPWKFTVRTASGRNWAITDNATAPATPILGAVNDAAGAFIAGQIEANPLIINAATGGNVGIGGSPLRKFHVINQLTAGGIASAFSSGPNGADSTTIMCSFTDGASAVAVGAITRTGTNSVAYNTTSDARLKDSVTESKRGLDALMAIKVSDYKMGKTAQQGLLAQDVAKVYPEAVHQGGKDPNLEPWMIDYGRMTPLIIKAFQDLAAKVDALSPPAKKPR